VVALANLYLANNRLSQLDTPLPNCRPLLKHLTPTSIAPKFETVLT